MPTQSATVKNGITEGVIWKQLLWFFFPILFGTFFQQLYNTVDAVIVGQFVGKEALAAVGGTTSVLINLVVNLFVGISSGTTVVISQFYGAHHYHIVRKTVHTSMALALAGGAIMTLLGVAASPAALSAMGTPADIMEYAVTYIRVFSLGMIASFIYNIGSGILRAIGDTKRPLYFLIAACLTNIVLDLVLVLGLNLGVFGVALATLISQWVSAVLVIITLMRFEGCCRLMWRHVRFYPNILKSVLFVGFPAGLQSDMYAVSNILIQSCINTFGTDTVAAWTAYGKVDGFFWMIMSAYGVSVTTFVGQNFGAQKYERIRQSVRVCLCMTLGTAIGASLLFLTFGKFFLSLFTPDQQVIAIGMQMMHIIMPFYFSYICVEVLSGAIRGTGQALIPMLVTGGGVCLFRVLWIFFVLPFWHNLVFLFASYPISWALTSLLFIVYYVHGGWLQKQIARANFSSRL